MGTHENARLTTQPGQPHRLTPGYLTGARDFGVVLQHRLDEKDGLFEEATAGHTVQAATVPASSSSHPPPPQETFPRLLYHYLSKLQIYI